MKRPTCTLPCYQMFVKVFHKLLKHPAQIAPTHWLLYYSNPVEVLKKIFFRLLMQLYKLRSQLLGPFFIWFHFRSSYMIYFIHIYLEELTTAPAPGRGFWQIPTTGTDKMTNAWQMPGVGGWACLELTHTVRSFNSKRVQDSLGLQPNFTFIQDPFYALVSLISSISFERQGKPEFTQLCV